MATFFHASGVKTELTKSNPPLNIPAFADQSNSSDLKVNFRKHDALVASNG